GAGAWLFRRARPSTVTSPASIIRCALAREPTSGSAAKRTSRRMPPSSGPAVKRSSAITRRRTALDHPQQHEDTEDDAHVRHVEGGPQARIYEVRDRAHARAVRQVAERPAQEQADGYPQMRRVRAHHEIDDERPQRE